MNGSKSESTSVIAGVVTYNPELERLRENISSIASQVGKVIVVDNCSANLGEIESLSSEMGFRLVANEGNLGIGKALNQIMEVAEDSGAEYAYLLDQDSVSCEGMIDGLLSYAGEGIAIVSPVIIDRNKRDRLLSFTEACEPKDRPITSGSLIATRVWREVGCFDPTLFIEFVDYEFDERCLQAGYRNVQVNTVQLLQEGGHAERSWLISGVQRNASGRLTLKHPYRYGYSPKRLYYRYRNMIVFLRRFDTEMTNLSSTRAQMAKQIIHDLVIEKITVKSLKAIIAGLRDGGETDCSFRTENVDKHFVN